MSKENLIFLGKEMRKMGKLLVFHDGWCAMCRKSARKAKRFDWLRKVEFASFREPHVEEKYGFSQEAMEKRIHGVDLENGRVFQGIGTVLEVAKRLPVCWVAVPFLYVSVWVGLGEKVYDWIASRRNVVPVGQCELHGCSLDRKPLE